MGYYRLPQLGYEKGGRLTSEREILMLLFADTQRPGSRRGSKDQRHSECLCQSLYVQLPRAGCSTVAGYVRAGLLEKQARGSFVLGLRSGFMTVESAFSWGMTY